MQTIGRSISETMCHEDEVDVGLLQPPLFRPGFPEDKDLAPVDWDEPGLTDVTRRNDA